MVLKKKKHKVSEEYCKSTIKNESLPELIHTANPSKSACEIEQEIEDALDRIENGTAVFYSADEFTNLLKKEGLI